jgi:A/G-specific adenine glycosylase
VYLHFFFPQKEKINDKELFPLIEATLDHENPREWYYALMDYGAMLKRTQTNPNRRSSHHSRQSPFKGSHRELRSKVLTYIIENQLSSAEKIAAAIPMPLAKASETADELLSEGLLQKTGALYFVD